MRNTLLLSCGALGMALALSSCITDPYYAPGGSYASASYSSYDSYSGYGAGYGYGSPSFSTTFFVSTGDTRWGYDPYCYSYYDYHRRCYYDPYLCGYYPVGYRPPVVVGCPHPYGWRPGRSYCPPPNQVRNITVVNYRNREASYRNLNHSWARNVREDFGKRPNHQSYDRSRENFGNHRQTPQQSRDDSRTDGFRRPGTSSGDRKATLPPNLNQPVTLPENRMTSGTRPSSGLGRTRDFTPPPQGGFRGTTTRGQRGDPEPNRSGKIDASPNRSERPTPRENTRQKQESNNSAPHSDNGEHPMKHDKRSGFQRR